MMAFVLVHISLSVHLFWLAVFDVFEWCIDRINSAEKLDAKVDGACRMKWNSDWRPNSYVFLQPFKIELKQFIHYLAAALLS